MSKRCPKCNLTKAASEFYKGDARNGGLSGYCKKCCDAVHQKYRDINKANGIRKKFKKCGLCKEVKPAHEFHLNACSKDGLHSRCKVCVRSSRPRKTPVLAKGYKMCPKCKQAKELSEFYSRNKNGSLRDSYCIPCKRKYDRDLRTIDINTSRRKDRESYYANALNYRMSIAIRRCLKGGKHERKWSDLVGYNAIQLKGRLISTMPSGYSWDDYLSGQMHIDHIIPIAVFNFSKPEHPDFRKCWALSNLRLLPSKENLQKGCRIDVPFQPSLALEEMRECQNTVATWS